MRHRLRVALSVSVLAVACLLASQAAEAVPGLIDIDAFSTLQGPLTGPAANATPALEVWGGERDVRVTRISGANTVTAQVTGGNLVFAAGAATAGDVEVVWDGADNDATRVGRVATPLDLTAGGGDSFQITVASATNANAHLILEVFKDGSHSWVRAFPIPQLSSPRTFHLSYAGFVPNRGASAVDFTSVRAIRMFVRGTGVTVNVDGVQAGVVAAATVVAQKTETHGPAAPGDTLNYGITVQGSGGDAQGVQLSDVVDANTTYVNGSLKASPIALNDAYPNADVPTVASPLSISSAVGVINNDRDPLARPMTVVSTGTITSARGNAVSMAADGSFTWTDSVGVGGIPDSFTYTLGNDWNDAALRDTALVVITQTDAAPTITGTTPAEGAVVATDTKISFSFSEPVTAAVSDFTIDCGGSRAFTLAGSGTSTITLTPSAALPTGTACTVTVLANGTLDDTDTIDPPGGLDADFVLHFSTDAPPSVTSTSPTNGAVVAADTTFVVNFSEPVNFDVNSFVIDCGGALAFAAAGSGTNKATLTPSTALPFGTSCVLTVLAAQVTDVDAIDPPDTMVADYKVNFSVDAAPSVVSTVPANGATGVSRTTDITVNFSEPVDVTLSTFKIECPAPGNAQAFTIPGATTNVSAVTLHPTAALPDGVTCTVTVSGAAVSDHDTIDPPDHLVADYVFAFKVPPRAVDDGSIAVTGNVRINTNGRSGFSVLTNDFGPGRQAVTVSGGTTLRGGTYDLNADGTFDYNPPVGYRGPDSFTYTITNAAGTSAAATVTFSISNMLWFLDGSSSCDTFPAASCGRLTSPMKTLGTFTLSNGATTDKNNDGTTVIDPKANDAIFMVSGSYTGPLTLVNGQHVVGAGATTAFTGPGLSGVTLAPDSDAVPATGGTQPVIDGSGNGFNLASNNELYGLEFRNIGGTAIKSTTAAGTFKMADIKVDNATVAGGSGGDGITFTGGATGITASGINTIATRTGTALTVVNTTIGAGGLTFRSISAGNGSSGPNNGIVLNNTGSTAALTVTGSSSGQCGGNVNTATNPYTVTGPDTADCSGGIIQHTTGAGISLTNTQAASFTRMWIHNTRGSGVDGTQVRGFTFTIGLVEKSGLDDSLNLVPGASPNTSNLAFNDIASGVLNLSGAVSVTNSTLRNAWYHGIDIYDESGAGGAGAISSLTISSNVITSSSSFLQSRGSGIRAQVNGNGGGAGEITKATIASNVVQNFPSNSAIKIQGGNGAGGPQAVLGSPGDATNVVSIAGNAISGASSAQPLGSNGIEAAMTGKGKAKFSITNNGTATAPVQHFLGSGITCSGGNLAQVVCIVSGNVIDAADNIFGSAGMAVGSQLGIGQAGSITASITNNTVNNADNHELFAGVVNSGNTGAFIIKNNTFGRPQGHTAEAIQVNSGSAFGNTSICVDMSANTATGSDNSDGVFAPGIAVRKQGTDAAANVFGIVGLTPSPATANQTEDAVAGANPNSALGSPGFSNDNSRTVGAIVTSGSNFVSCSPFAVN
jgi:uncharacterized repeat protein (TIGR01451 family)